MHPLDRLEWPRRSARLALRRATAGDAAAAWTWRRDPGTEQWLTTRTDEEAFTRRWLDGLADTVVAELDGRLVASGKVSVEDGWGQAEVAARAAASQAEIGWVVAPAARGQGVGAEFAAALAQLAFDAGLRRVVAHCFADNTASWRLMERIGMRREAHFVADSLHRDGQWLDSFTYALLADERNRLPAAPRASVAGDEGSVR